MPRAAMGTALLFKKQLIMVALLLGVRCLGMYAIPDDMGGSEKGKMPQLSLPRQLGAWSGHNIEIAPVIYEVLHPDAVLQKRYQLASPVGAAAPPSGDPAAKSSAATVEVLIVYSRDPKGFHSPVTCLRSQGWTVANEETKIVAVGGKNLMVNILTGEIDDNLGKRQTKLAYCFTDASEAVSGRIATFAKMVAARFMRRRVGAVEMQFAYNNRSMLPNGDFTPEFKDLMLQTAASVRHQLANDQ